MTALVELGRADCMRLLAQETVGRVGLSTPLGPRIVPVNYALVGDDILFRTTPYSELGTYGRNTDAAFEVDRIDVAAGRGSSAVAVGRVEAVRDCDGLGSTQDVAGPIPWADGRRCLYMRLHIRDLTGQTVRPDEKDVVPGPEE